ncbi:MAG: aspartate--ammonia ligase [Spirochaetales bacterium]|nr:aspartate--ammonia ligase [Spirochaetales bacterium]
MDILKHEQQVEFAKATFAKELSSQLNLTKVSSPLFVDKESGIQDNLNGIERPVSFKIREVGEQRTFEIVHSLAKWKRLFLGRYKIQPGVGILTDMKALRPDEDTLRTRIHSVYVDQWDWEKVMADSERNVEFLMQEVEKIYTALKNTESAIEAEYGIPAILPAKIKFVHADQLRELYPELNVKQREGKFAEKHGAFFIIGIGGKLLDDTIHDGRAPDYDDWITPGFDGLNGLNGDIVVWNPVLQKAVEISSMGIRVNEEVLRKQLAIRKCEERAEYPWHKSLLNGEFPQTIGGGIGQSRVCMFLLRKKHIAEVHISQWPADVVVEAEAEGVHFLE